MLLDLELPRIMGLYWLMLNEVPPPCETVP